ncbi:MULTISPECIES: hypothetical protein [unclassified Myroides]|uniref:hypothetical protein n=1 Tax=unclassified Myroides TaxID=2642485 RepID=UPI003D2F967D
MKTSALLFCSLVLFGLWSCTDKSKETQEPERIKLNQSTSTTEQPVQIPMHGTKENSSSGMTSFKMKEEMKEENTEKNTAKE